MEEENRLLRQEIAELTARLELQQSKIELHPIVDYPARTGAVRHTQTTKLKKQQRKKEQHLQKMHASAREFCKMAYFLFSKLHDKALYGPASSSGLFSPSSASPSMRRAIRELSLSGPEVVNVRGRITIGSPATTSSLTIRLLRAPDVVAQLAKDIPKASRDSVLCSLSFVIKEGVDDFEVGELSGCLRDILTTAGKSLQCTHKVKLGKGANGERLFVIVFGFEHPTAQKELQTLLSSFEELQVKIEGEGLKHYASDKGPFLRSMINGHTVELSLAFRKSLLKIFKDPTSAFGQLGEQFSWLLPWVSLLRHSEADIRIEDLLQSVEGHKANKARRSIPAIVRDVIAQPDVQPVIKSLYSSGMSLLVAPYALQLHYKHSSDQILQVEAKNLVLAELLPGAEEIKRGPMSCALLSVDRQQLPPFIHAGLRTTYESLDRSRDGAETTTPGKEAKYRVFKYHGQVGDRIFRFGSFAPSAFAQLLAKHGTSLAQLTDSFQHLKQIRSEGKSGSSFFTSVDRRFIVKTITNGEWRFLRSIFSDYFEHVDKHKSTLLCKFLGLHSLQTDEGREFFVVMAHVFSSPERPIHLRYDLKGCVEGRLTATNDASRTLRDQDFLGRSLYLGPLRSSVLQQLAHDCKFLESCGIMDYSFFVGIHKMTHDELLALQKRELEEGGPIHFHDGGVLARSGDGGLHEERELYYFGVIDLMQPWTLRKVCEAKIKGVLFAQNQLSAVEPSMYAQRFQQYLASKLV